MSEAAIIYMALEFFQAMKSVEQNSIPKMTAKCIQYTQTSSWYTFEGCEGKSSVKTIIYIFQDHMTQFFVKYEAPILFKKNENSILYK